MTISDTELEAQRIQDELIRAMPVWRRLEIMASLNDTSRQLAL